MLLIPFALLAAGSDAALYWSVSNHYAQHGHLGARPDLSIMALGFTALTVFGSIAFWRELRKRKAPTRKRRA